MGCYSCENGEAMRKKLGFYAAAVLFYFNMGCSEDKTSEEAGKAEKAEKPESLSAYPNLEGRQLSHSTSHALTTPHNSQRNLDSAQPSFARNPNNRIQTSTASACKGRLREACLQDRKKCLWDQRATAAHNKRGTAVCIDNPAAVAVVPPPAAGGCRFRSLAALQTYCHGFDADIVGCKAATVGGVNVCEHNGGKSAGKSCVFNAPAGATANKICQFLAGTTSAVARYDNAACVALRALKQDARSAAANQLHIDQRVQICAANASNNDCSSNTAMFADDYCQRLYANARGAAAAAGGLNVSAWQAIAGQHGADAAAQAKSEELACQQASAVLATADNDDYRTAFGFRLCKLAPPQSCTVRQGVVRRACDNPICNSNQAACEQVKAGRGVSVCEWHN